MGAACRTTVPRAGGKPLLLGPTVTSVTLIEPILGLAAKGLDMSILSASPPTGVFRRKPVEEIEPDDASEGAGL